MHPPLQPTFIPLSAEKILSYLQQADSLPPNYLTILQRTNSTNDYLKKIPTDNLVHICLAEAQDSGRGQFNRPWHSPFGENIYFSCRYPLHDKTLADLAGLSLAVSLAVKRALTSITPHLPIQVKWPNDLLIQHKKIAGILTEIFHGTADNYVIIGIGINVNMINNPSTTLTAAWTSLQKETGHMIDRNRVCAALIQHLLTYLEIFLQAGLVPFMTEWQAADSLANQKITLAQGKKRIHGIVRGITKNGNLCLETKDKQLHTYASGEVSIIKK